MKVSRSTALAIGILILWLAFAWKLGSWMHLHPPILYYLRGGLWLIGLAGFGGYFLLRPPSKQDVEGDASAEIDFAFREAAKRLRAARGVKHLNHLSTVFLLGDTGSAKTSILAKSGIEPELLAGSAYQDFAIAPTRVLNLWFSGETLFVDPGGTTLTDEGSRRKLIKKFFPVRLNAVVTARLPPARAAVFTLDIETFLQPGGAEILAGKAREFQALLSELSGEAGASFPVYVVFTKADRIPYFRDFAEGLTEPEITAIFGKTLLLQTAEHKGVYAEEQTRRLTNAFQDLYYDLSDRRPAMLAREHDSGKLPNIYEFAREFAKLRPLLVQFLVDLCRPSQLGTTPFLRGFYFTGVRPVTITDLSPAAVVEVPMPQEDLLESGATRIFNPRGQHAGVVQAQSPGAGSRKVPEWVFLTRLFSETILQDRTATTVAQINVKVNLARRLLFAAAAIGALAMAGWWTVSYLNNRALIRDAVEAARAVPPASLASGELASLDSLQKLTRVRKTLGILGVYHREGAPLEYDAFLYTGENIRQPLRATYYALFRKLLLAPTQATLAAICGKPEAYEAQGYSYLYDSLKAYLITTSHPEKSTSEFLTPALALHWPSGISVDKDRLELARDNFEFYAKELREDNPYPQFGTPNGVAVDTARAFLKRFKQEDRIYNALLSVAGHAGPPIVFNVDFPGSAETVINKYRVNPAFTAKGAAAFDKELEDPARYFSGEEWVLGEPINPAQDRQTLKQDLAARYGKDLIKTWQEFLDATSVVSYGSVPDAANKLNKLSSPQSALLQVLCVASENTKSATAAFQPVQFVTPPGCSAKLVGSADNGYMQALIGLAASLKAVGPIGNADPNNVAAAGSLATQAESSVSNLALGFQADPANPNSKVLSRTEQLLRDPIARVPPLLKDVGKGPINNKAGDVCKSVSALLNKYPFNPKSPVDASLAEVNEFLKPGDGRLWQFYNDSLKQLMVPAGPDYVRATGQSMNVTDGFLRFFNRAAHLSQALYSGNAQAPNLIFTMQAQPMPDVTHVDLKLDGQTLSTDLKSGSRSQQFAWPGSGSSASLSVKFGETEFTIAQSSGLWAAWHLLETSDRVAQNSNLLDVEWTQKTSGAGPVLIKGHPATVKFSLDSQSSQIFRPQYFSGLVCTSKAVQ